MTIPNNPSLSGSIVLVKGTHFLSKQIMMHMEIYARMTGRKPIRRSHGETLMWYEPGEMLITAGSRNHGPKLSRVDEYYHDQEITILRPKIQLTDDQINVQWNRFYEIIDAGYDEGSFLSWITALKLMPLTPPRPFESKEHYQERMIRTYEGLFRDNDKAFNCYRMCAHLSDAAGLWPEGKSLDMVSIYDLYENENYEIYKP